MIEWIVLDHLQFISGSRGPSVYCYIISAFTARSDLDLGAFQPYHFTGKPTYPLLGGNFRPQRLAPFSLVGSTNFLIGTLFLPHDVVLFCFFFQENFTYFFQL